jgi:hypothetical protein
MKKCEKRFNDEFDRLVDTTAFNIVEDLDENSRNFLKLCYARIPESKHLKASSAMVPLKECARILDCGAEECKSVVGKIVEKLWRTDMAIVDDEFLCKISIMTTYALSDDMIFINFNYPIVKDLRKYIKN